ncbi:MAG: diguanylate cyclase [Chloroflexota bacterium]
MDMLSQGTTQANILIVDDNPDNLRILSQMLKIYGYKVRAVTDGPLALNAALAAAPNLIMLDINMPVMNGFETCQRLKAEPRLVDIPVIFISAMDDVQDKVKAFSVGGVDYVTKPFQIEEVVARIETHLSLRSLHTQLENVNRELTFRLQELSRAREAEREQRLLAEALRDTIAALNSTLNFDEVLDLILANLGRVIHHDAANIALIDETNHVTFKRALGYAPHDKRSSIFSLNMRADEVPTWRAVMKTRKPLIIPDTSKVKNWSLITGFEWIRSYACAPIIVKGEVIGFINLDSAVPGFFKPEQTGRLQTFADQAAVAIEKSRLFDETQRLAITDGLTNIYNRRHLLKLADQEYSRARRYHRPLSALMIDIDHFKHVNDTYGHPVGDLALKTLVQCCKQNLRDSDLLGRYGGEEFLVLMPETHHTKALEAAERIRQRVESLKLADERNTISITISIGVATMQENEALSLDILIRNADDALYTAKAAGRNCVRSYSLHTLTINQ